MNVVRGQEVIWSDRRGCRASEERRDRLRQMTGCGQPSGEQPKGREEEKEEEVTSYLMSRYVMVGSSSPHMIQVLGFWKSPMNKDILQLLL